MIIKDVNKTFGDNHVLKDISATFEPGNQHDYRCEWFRKNRVDEKHHRTSPH